MKIAQNLKPAFHYAFLFFLPVSLMADEQMITVKAKIIESSEGSIPHDLEKLSKLKDMDIMATPSVTTKSDQSAPIEIHKDHQPASLAPSNFESVTTGCTVLVTPHLKGDEITYTAKITVSEPIFNQALEGLVVSEFSSRVLYVSGTAKDGEIVWLDFKDPSNVKNLTVWMQFKRGGP